MIGERNSSLPLPLLIIIGKSRGEGDYYIGRTEFDSPEVDPEVLIDRLDGTSLIIGNFYQIEVVDSDDFDLFGKVV